MRLSVYFFSLIFFITTLLLPTSAVFAEGIDYRQSNTILGWKGLGLSAYFLVARDNLLFICDSYPAHLRVLDVSDPASPELIGSLEYDGRGGLLKLVGDRLYLGESDGLWIFDISDPTQLSVLGFVGLPESILGFEIHEDYVYVANAWTSLRIVDVSDPTAPFVVGDLPTGGAVNAVVINYPYVVVNSGNSAFWVIDVENPESPQVISVVNHPFDIRNMMLVDSHILISDYFEGIHVYDLNDPINPEYAGGLSDFGRAFDFSRSGDKLFVLDNNSGMHVLDISGLPRISYDHFIPQCRDFVRLTCANGLVHVLNHRMYQTIDPNVDTSQPPPFYEFQDDGVWRHIQYVDNLLYASSDAAPGHSSFIVADANGAGSAGGDMIQGELPLHNYPREFQIQGNYAYISVAHRGLAVLDISDPRLPREVGVIDRDFMGETSDVVVKENVAFVGWAGVNQWEGYITVYEVGKFQGITVLADFYTDSQVKELELSGNILVALTRDFRLLTFSVSSDISGWGNEPLLKELGEVGVHLDPVKDLVLEGSIAFALGRNELGVVDFSDPENPVLLDLLWLPAPQTANELAVKDGILYISTTYAGVLIYDVSDPNNLEFIGSINTPDHNFGLSPGEEALYVSSYDGTLRAWSLQAPISGRNEDWELDESYLGKKSLPEKSTTLHLGYSNSGHPAPSVGFSLLESEKVRLDVFDMRGRRIKTLLNASLAPGEHVVTWSGRDESGRAVAAGVYFYHLISGLSRETRKIVLVR